MRNRLLLFLLLVSIPIMGIESVYAQANKTNSGEVLCPSSVGAASIEIINIRSSRYSYTINNTSVFDVRIGFLPSGIANLTASNSWVLKAGQPYADSVPGVYNGRVVCMMNSATTALISFNETFR